MLYQAVLFDMDGVLIDTHRAVTDFWLTLAAEYQVQLSADDFTRHIYGVPGTHTLDLLFPMIQGEARAAIFHRMNHYEANQQYIPVAGVLAVLAALKQHGIPAALVTSGDRHKVTEVSRQLGLEDAFKGVVTVEDIERGKLPRPLSQGRGPRRRLAQCCVVFSSLQRRTAGVAAGALVVSIGTGSALREVGAAHLIPDFDAIKFKPLDDSTLEMRFSSEWCLL
ncbi:MAG: HAD family phosphatase [Anaerolineae bacterium]